jgi:hypothetical protein
MRICRSLFCCKRYRRQELTEFKLLDKVDPSTFSSPADADGAERKATIP